MTQLGQTKKEETEMKRKTTVCIFQAKNLRDSTREVLDMAT